MELTSQQKLELLRSIESSLSLGIMKAMEFYRFALENMNTDFLKSLEDGNKSIKELEKSQIDAKKILDERAKEIIEETRLILKGEADKMSKLVIDSLPKRGEQYFTEEDINGVVDTVVSIVVEKVQASLGKPKDGVTPIAGIDFPTREEIGMNISEAVRNAISEKDEDTKQDITGEEIVDKLNVLKGKIDISVIGGLEDTLKDITKAIRDKQRGGNGSGKSGGGMGNWIHQQFSLTTSTASVTLSSKVAAGGTAIMVRYQGQLLAHAVQYTVSNSTKSVTLQGLTPENGTFLDVTYVRS